MFHSCSIPYFVQPYKIFCRNRMPRYILHLFNNSKHKWALPIAHKERNESCYTDCQTYASSQIYENVIRNSTLIISWCNQSYCLPSRLQIKNLGSFEMRPICVLSYLIYPTKEFFFVLKFVESLYSASYY